MQGLFDINNIQPLGLIHKPIKKYINYIPPSKSPETEEKIEKLSEGEEENSKSTTVMVNEKKQKSSSPNAPKTKLYYKFDKRVNNYIEEIGSEICKMCGKEFRDKYVAQYHIEHQHFMLPYICKYQDCKSTFKTLKDIKLHIEDEHLNLQYRQAERDLFFSKVEEPKKRKTKQKKMQKQINNQILTIKLNNCSSSSKPCSYKQKEISNKIYNIKNWYQQLNIWKEQFPQKKQNFQFKIKKQLQNKNNNNDYFLKNDKKSQAIINHCFVIQ